MVYKPTRRALVPSSTIIAAAIIIVLLTGAIVAGVVWSGSRRVSVPDVTDLPIAIAERALDVLGLDIAVEGTRVSVDVPQGAVVTQDPVAGSEVRRGDVITVVVSAGPQTFLLPDVIGMQIDAARDELVSAGLVVNVVTASSEASQGIVVEMYPSPGSSVNTGDEVRLTVPGGGDEEGDALLPYDLAGQRIVLDPSPPAAGAEDDPVLEVARRLSSLLQAAGADVFVTRSATDTVPTVAERLETATSADATVLVGIDLGSGGEAGLRVLTASAAGQSGETFARSAAFASSVTRAARLPGLVVLEPAVSEDPVVLGFTGPAIRVVVGDGTAEADRARMADPGWADSVARAIYRGLGMELAPQ